MLNNIKILHIITSLRTGGAERLMVDLLPRLRDMGHEVDLLLFDGTRTPYFDELESRGIAIRSLGDGVADMHNPLVAFRLRQYLRRHRYDILHTHNTPCQLLTAMVSRGETLVTTEHNTINRRRKWGWYRGIDRWMYGKYRHIVCVSGGVEENLRRQLGDKTLASGISTILNGIDLGKFATAKPDAALRERYKNKRIIIMVAAFRRQKDQHTLLRAMRLLPDDYSLLLVGDGECRGECEDLAQTLGIADKVSFLGFRTDVPSLIATADVVVMSSHWEGFCLSVIEGMVCAKPVVATDVEVLDTIVGNVGVLSPHEDAHGLSEAIRRLCEDRELYSQVAERCRQYAMQYDINRMAREYEQTYKTILEV